MPRKNNPLPVKIFSNPPPPPTTSVEKHPLQTPPSVGFLGSMVQGFGLGAGSSMGHRAVDALLSSSSKESVAYKISSTISNDECRKYLDLYNSCMVRDGNDCEQLYRDFYVCSTKRDNL
jgi:hypothetical protein